MKKIAFVLGTRPEIIKLSPLIKLADKRKIPFTIIHTNQHYSENMDKVFFDQLRLPNPKYNLEAGSGSQATQLSKMLVKLEEVLSEERPDISIVQGDTNSVLAGALVSSRLGISIAHVEAGLRSYDRTMPEEINRICTDHISKYLFAPTIKQQIILKSENIDPNRIYITGNTIVDALNDIKKLIGNDKSKYCKDNYFVLTCHRPSNTDDQVNLHGILDGLNQLSSIENIKTIFPMHPRLNSKRKLIERYPSIEIVEPLGYVDMIKLLDGSKMIFTDSGGIQEEACILRKKTIVLRLNTERPEALEVGGSSLLDSVTSENIILKYHELIHQNVNWYNPFGDGNSSEKILDILFKS